MTMGEILNLSLLPANPKSINCSKASNSHMNNPICPNFILVRDFMIVLVICKFDEQPLQNEIAIVHTTFSLLYVYGRLKRKQLSLNSPIYPKIDFYQDLKAVLMKIRSQIISLL